MRLIYAKAAKGYNPCIERALPGKQVSAAHAKRCVDLVAIFPVFSGLTGRRPGPQRCIVQNKFPFSVIGDCEEANATW